MEELKYIVSKESQKGEWISIDEIKKLDKQKLWETLSNLDSNLKDVLLVWLKRLIKENLSLLQNSKDTSANKKAIVYALQIFWNLNWMNIKIDWNYTRELDSLDFKNLFNETKTNKTSISEKLGLSMDKLKDAKNLGDFLNTTIETLLKKYVQKLNSPEWISLKTSEIYKELVILIQEIDENLPDGNIYKWNSHLIINNFLTPKENWEKLINLVIDKLLNPNEKEIKSSDIDSLKIAMKWWLWMLIDIAKTSSDEKLKSYINEFKNIPKIKEYISKVPEFDKIFDLFISLLKTLDKNELFSQIDIFFRGNTDNLLKLSNKKPWEKIDDKIKLEVINWVWKIVDSLITKDRVNIALDKVSQFEFLCKNPFVSQIMDIINSSKLSQDDKYALFKEISKLVLNTTSQNFKDKTDQSQKIKTSLNTIIELISKFNKEWKLDEQKVIKLVKELLNWWEEMSFMEKIKKIRNLKELFSFLNDNFDTIKTFIWTSLKWWNGLDDAIKYFMRKYKLSDNIVKAWWNLIERLEKTFSLNTADMILSIRKTLLEDKSWGTQKIEENKSETQKAAQDIWGIVVDKISKRWFEFIKTKLNSLDLNQKKLTKEDIINSIFSWIWDIFKDSELKNRVFENLKKLWAKIDNKEQFIQNLITYFLNNSEFKSVINNVSTILIKRLSNSKDISGELDNIKNDINKLINDFIKNYEKLWVNWVVKTFNETKLFDEKTKNDMLLTSLTITYDYFKEPQNIELLLKSFPEISKKLPVWISESKISKILVDFLKAIPKNVIEQVLLAEFKNGFNFEDLNKENILNLFNKILLSKEVNKDAILQSVIDLELWKVSGLNAEKSWEKTEISKELISSWIDSLYTLLSSASKDKVNALITSLGLDKIFSEALDTTFKNIPKEILKKTLIWNIDFIDSSINWNVDINKWLKFVSELYKNIPVEKRLLVVDDLVWNLSWRKEWWWNDFKIDSVNSKYLSDIIYATLDTNDIDKLLSIVSKLSPSLWTLLSQKDFLDKSNLSVWVSIFKSISKEKFQNFLQKNQYEINSLMVSKDKNVALKLAIELFWDVNSFNLKENLSKDKKLSKNENFIIDMSFSIQKSFEKNKSKLENIIKIWKKIKNHFESWEKDLAKNWLTKQEIVKFSEDLFDIISDTLDIELKNIMEEQWLSNITDARIKLAERFDIPASIWDSKIDMSKISFFDFFMSNPWFSIYWGLAYLFKWKDYVIKNAGIDFFQDKSKKWDFSKMIWTYFS